MQPSTRPRLALLALLAGAAGIAFAPIPVRLSQVGPTATAFYRILLALPALWMWMTLEQRQADAPERPATAGDFRWLIIAGLFFAGDLALWHGSIKLTSIANASLLANFAPIFVTLGAGLIFAERIPAAFLFALVMSLAGAAMLVGASLNLTPRHLAGDGLGLATAVFYAGYQLSVKHLRGRFSAATIMTWSGLASAPVLLVIALAAGERLLPADAGGWGILIALALISHVGGQGLIAHAFGHLPASLSSLTLLSQPVFAALLAWLCFREGVSPMQMAGGALTLSGLYLANRGRAGGSIQTLAKV